MAGCGDNELSFKDTDRVAEAQVAFSRLCLDGSHFLGTLRGVDAIIRIFRKDPNAIYQPGGEGEKRTMRQVVADSASMLADCDRTEADKLDRALEAG